MIDESTTYTQPTTGAGPQSQAATIPQTSLNAQGQGVESQSILLGTSTGYDTASLLNQTRVLGTSSTQETTAPKTLKPDSRGHVPIMVITVALVMMVLLALLFRMIDNNRKSS